MTTVVTVILVVAFLVCLAGMVLSSLRASGTRLIFPSLSFPALKGRRGSHSSSQASQNPQANQQPASQGPQNPSGGSNSSQQAPTGKTGPGAMTYLQLLRERFRQSNQDQSNQDQGT